jgi:hypothetical protein
MKRKMQYWRDEASSVRPGLHLRSWRVDGAAASPMPPMMIEVCEPGWIVQRLDTREQDKKVRFLLWAENTSQSLVTGWMAPNYPVTMGSVVSLEDRAIMAWWGIRRRIDTLVSRVRGTR